MRQVIPVLFVMFAVLAPQALAQQLIVREIGEVTAGSSDILDLAVSPNGRYAAITVRDSEMWLFDLQTGAQRALDVDVAWYPAWSPSSGEIAYTRVGTQGRDVNFAIGVAEGAMPRSLVVGSGTYESPAYSPDGASIAYVGTAGCDNDMSCYRLFIAPSRGGEAREITTHVGWLVDWSPDGRWIYYALGRGRGGYADIYRINPTGDQKELFITGGDVRLSDIGLTRDGRYFAVALGERSGSPANTLVVYTIEGTEVLRRELPEGIFVYDFNPSGDLIGLRKGGDRPVLVEIELSELLP